MSKQVDELDKLLDDAFGSSGTSWHDKAVQDLSALIQQKQLEAVAEAKAELRAKFGIDADKQYDVKIGNGVIVAQLQPTKEQPNE